MNQQVLQFELGGAGMYVPEMPSVDLLFADPPYNFGVEYLDDPTRDALPSGEYQARMKRSLWQARVRLHPGATVWWLCPSAHMDWVGPMLRHVIGPRVYCIIKSEPFSQYQQKTLTNDYRLLYCHRYLPNPDMTFKPTFNPDAIRIPSARQETYGDKRANPAGRVPGQVWNIRRLQGTSSDHVDWHNAQLPPELVERIVKGWTNPGDHVLEMFAGSGSMAVACKRLGRNYTGLERSATYCEKMRERLGQVPEMELTAQPEPAIIGPQ